MEDAPYRESAPLLPRNLAYIVAAVLAATLVCMVATEYLTDAEMPSWVIAATAVIFVAAVAFMLAARMDVEVGPEGVTIRYLFRTRTYPRDQILDKRSGDLEDIRNYSRWNLKGVSHRSYTRIGDECGVALKLKGKMVVVFSSADPDRACGLVPTEVPEDARVDLPLDKGPDVLLRDRAQGSA